VIIALYSSAPQAGKSEVAKALESVGFKVLKFAAPLKDMVRSLLRYTGMMEIEIEAHLEGNQKETPIPALGGRSARFLLQTLGTEWGRGLVDPNIWVDLLIGSVNNIIGSNCYEGVVVDDMRFPNEYRVMKDSLGAKMVWVKRPGVVAKTDHKSEGLLDDKSFDIEILNQGQLSTLQQAAYALIP